MKHPLSKFGCLLALALVGAGAQPLAAGQTKLWGLVMGLAALRQALAGGPLGPAGTGPEPVVDADGLGLEPVLVPVSVWGDLSPLRNDTDPGPGPKRGAVSGPMARALAVYPRDRCPGDRDWTLALPGGRGEAPPPLERPVQADWDRFGRTLATPELAAARVAHARALAAEADYAFCRLVHRYNHPVERHRKDALVRQLDDAMFLFNAMIAERRELLRLQATFEARLKESDGRDSAEPGHLPLKDRLGPLREALEAIQVPLDSYLAARMPKVDARLQGRSDKEAREEERTQAAEFARPKAKKTGKASRSGQRAEASPGAKAGGKKLRGA